MNKLFTLLSEIIEEFSSAYKYAEYDFYELISDMTVLLENANAKGYDNPDICSLTINVANKLMTTVTIDAYYKKENGKYQKFSKKLEIGTLTNVPANVNNRLKTEKEIVVKLTDINSFKSIKLSDIIPIIQFDNLCNFKLEDAVAVPDKKELHITDNLFYYKVVLVYKYQDGKKDTKIKYFGNIAMLPSEIIDKISSSDDHSCYIDVTN